ncbi:AaceriADR385Wp [[Ashbya] aceris (nom. inval.)]|nr:AaceriADR385Wp [[Ashbya] aceris (nom. inval.)]
MSKRAAETGRETTRSKRVVDLDRKLRGGYEGYAPADADAAIEVIDEPTDEQSVRAFYARYVAGRRPCKIRARIPGSYDWARLSSSRVLEMVSGAQELQVERKVAGGFGSGAQRLSMPFAEFLERLRAGERDLYLTTQYGDDAEASGSEEEEEDEEDETAGTCAAALGDVAEGDYEGDSATETERSDTFTTAMDTIGDEDSDDVADGDARDDYDELEDGADPIVELETGPLYELEAQERVRELYQAPLTELVGSLPILPAFLPSLIPQQINIWMGGTAVNDRAYLSADMFDPEDDMLGLGRRLPGAGTSSGLHHDHADNVYIPIEGHKRFTLFSPADAAKMYTIGDIEHLHQSGVIDYKRNDKAPGWRSLRDDGAIVAEVAAHRLQLDSESLSDQEKQKLRRTIEEDSEMVAVHGSDPPHFSRVPPAAVHLNEIEDEQLRALVQKEVRVRWPLFERAYRIVVDLEPGEMLWLPTGWFHEVTSLGDRETNIHTAVNYWLIPPTGSDMDDPYPHKDRYWPLDFERTKAALAVTQSDS